MPGLISILLLGSILPVQSVETVDVEVHELGGAVVGFGFAGEYGPGGPGGFRLRRQATRPLTATSGLKERFESMAMVRVMDPDGNLVTWVDLSDQDQTEVDYVLRVPDGKAGVWRLSVSGGAGGDRYRLSYPATETWAIRGEMAFRPTGERALKRGWLWLPEDTREIRIVQYPCGPHPDGFVAMRVGGRDLVAPPAFRLQDDALPKPRDGINVVAFSDARMPEAVLTNDLPRGVAAEIDLTQLKDSAFALDGVPGWLCPSEAAAMRLRGLCKVVDGRRMEGPLQERAYRRACAFSPQDFAVNLVWPKSVPDDLDDPMSEALCWGRYATLSGLENGLAGQCLDCHSPAFGQVNGESIFVDGFACVAANPSILNPARDQPGLYNRTVLGMLRNLWQLQGDDLLREGKLGSYPIIHFFFVYESMANALLMVKGHVDEATWRILAEGVMAMGDKSATYRAYQSNQWTDMWKGHFNVYRATGERRFLERFERAVRAYFGGAYGPAHKFGQHPAGFYLEEMGTPDGNYDHLNSYKVVSVYYAYRDLPEANPEIVKLFRDGIGKNLAFKRFHCVRQPDGSIFAANALNGRTNGSLANPSYPGDILAAREFDWAYTFWKSRSRVNPGDRAAAKTMPQLVNDETWALENLKDLVPKGGTAYPYVAYSPSWTRPLQQALALPLTATVRALPCEGRDGFWKLPGQVAFKTNGFYGVVYYANAGGEERFMSNVTSGGPLQLQTPELGTFISSMTLLKSPKRRDGRVPWGAVTGKKADGSEFVSGKEFGLLERAPSGFGIRSRLRGLPGELVWSYEFSDDGLRLVVLLEASELSEASLSLPIRETFVESVAGPENGRFVLSGKTGGVVLTFAPEISATYESEPIFSSGVTVRLLRLVFPPTGRIVLSFKRK